MTQDSVLSRDSVRARAEAFNDRAADNFTAATRAVKTGDVSARLDICAGLLTAGFRNPCAIPSIYDGLAAGWLAVKPARPGNTTASPRAGTAARDWRDSDFSVRFWGALWQLFDDAADHTANSDAIDITARVAALGGELDPRFGELAEAAAAVHPGAAGAELRTPPPMIDLQAIGRAPEKSLARDLHSMLVDNGYNAEVLDRQALGLANLPPALSYLNTRILQMHDVWHLVAGYRTTSLHEIAISSFQLAQFGHNYSAMFLGVVVTLSTLTRPEGLPILLQIISEAWRHGRSTPSLMAVPWEDEWHKPIDAIRAEQGIMPFESTLPADLLETLAGRN